MAPSFLLLLLLLLAASTTATAAAATSAAASDDQRRRVFVMNGLLGLAFASYLSRRGLRKRSLSRSGAIAVCACLRVCWGL